MELKKCITFVSSYKIYPNMEGELYSFGRMLSQEFELHLIVGKNQCPDYLKDYFKVYEYSKPFLDVKGLGFGFASCYKYLKNHETDILINVAKPFPVALTMIPASLFFDANTVFRITGDIFSDFKMYNNSFKKAKTYLLHNIVASYIYKKADKVISLGENLKNQAVKYGFNENKINILPQPFDYRPFKKDGRNKSELRSKLGLKQGHTVVLFIGSAYHIKAPDILKEIVDGIDDSHIQFCLIGSGLRSYFENYAEEKVKAVGKIPHEKIADYYHAADVLVQTSRREGLPNVILEALASELPVVATPVGENEHYIQRVASNVQEFIAYIQSDKLKPDSLPEWFDWETQKEKNQFFFRGMLNES